MNIKKIICLLLMVTILLLCLSSCLSSLSEGDVKSVKIDSYTYTSYYLYYFEEADISGYSTSIYNDGRTPTESGYVYSDQKLSVGDAVEVWNTKYFYDEEKGSSSSSSSSSRGTTATVKKIVECYPVKVKRNKETYTITHFGTGYGETATEISDMAEREKSIVELTKDRVTIEYYAD